MKKRDVRVRIADCGIKRGTVVGFHCDETPVAVDGGLGVPH